MSAVGFDFGTSSCYVAIARAGGIETVANEYSHRLTPSVASLGEKERFIGTSGQNQIVTNLKNTVWNFKTLIGKKFSDPVVARLLRIVPYEIIQTPGDNIGVKVTYAGEENIFSPEQMVAMVLGKLKKIAETNLGTRVTDCVVSVPSYFTDGQRRGMLHSCQIAGLNCLRLMNDTTAAALAYGIYKQDLPEPSEKPRNVVFVDIGESALQVSACAFNKGKLRILATASDPMLGGQDFNFILREHFADAILKKYKLDCRKKPKALLRLGTACVGVKKQMSAISTPIPLNIECLMDDKDVSGAISRAEFEELAKDLLLGVKIPCEAVLHASGLKKDQITAVEIIGGSSRVPAVKQIIAEVFGKEPNTTLNQDEAVAKGCAVQCAMLSPTFKVRDFSITDVCNSAISLSWKTQEMDEDGEAELFKRTSAIPSTKMLTFFRKEPFELEAIYATDWEQNVHLGRFRVEKVKPTGEGDASKVKVKARVDIHGIFKMSRAELYEKAPPAPEPMEAESTEKTEGKTEQKAGETTEKPAEQNDSQNEPKREEQEKTETPAANEEKSEAVPEGEDLTDLQKAGEPVEEDAKEASSEQSKGGEPPEKKPKKPKYVTVSLPVYAVIPGMSKEELDNAVEKEGNMASQDKLEKERTDMKNAVEEYVYEIREKLMTTLEEFMAEKDREDYSRFLSQTEDWLYDEGEDQKKQVYIDKLAELKKLGNPVVRRFQENEGRQAAFDDLGKEIVHYRKILDLYSQKVELYDHIEEEEMKKVQEAVHVKQSWMTSKIQAQRKLAKHVDPVVLVSQIVSERESLEKTCKPIVTKPKPKVEPPKDDKKDDDKPKDGEDEEKPKEGEEGEKEGEPDVQKMEEGEPLKTSTEAEEKGNESKGSEMDVN
eukprot:m.13544 g.13544  ORF g.13544 m.13544 type:complete len:884 (+) comp25019_c0_seq1:140-2791(+)